MFVLARLANLPRMLLTLRKLMVLSFQFSRIVVATLHDVILELLKTDVTVLLLRAFFGLARSGDTGWIFDLCE